MGRSGMSSRLARAAGAAAAAISAARADLATGGAGAGAERRLGWGTLTAEATNPTFDHEEAGGFNLPSMMGSVQGEGTLPMPTADQQDAVSDESGKFIAAMVEAFLDKQKLQPGELDCIVKGSSKMGGNVGRIGNQLGMVVQTAFDTDLPGVSDTPTGGAGMMGRTSGHIADGAGSIEDKVAEMQRGGGAPSSSSFGGDWAPAPMPQAQARPAHTPAPAPADPSLNFFYNNGRRLQMEPGMTGYQPVNDMTAARQPAQPQQQVSGGSSAGGDKGGGIMGAVPVAMEVGFYISQLVGETKDLVGKCVHSDAKEAFITAGEHARNFKYLSGHMLHNGGVIVKEFADSVLAYEEKDPARFGNDVGIFLRKVFLSHSRGELPEGLPGEPAIANVTAGWLKGFFGPGTAMKISFADHPYDSVRVDMNHCVNQNIRLFQQMWASTMYLFAQKAVGVEAAAQAASGGEKDEVQFGTMVAFTMMELPGAMDKCNIDEDHKDMILDSLKAFGHGMHMKFSLPRTDVEKKDIVEGFAQTVKDWSAHKYYEFGFGLGNVFRETMVKKFPQKYSISPGGILQTLGQTRSGNSAALVACMFPALFAFVVTSLLVKNRRRLQTAWRRAADWTASRDLERGGYSDEQTLLAVE